MYVVLTNESYENDARNDSHKLLSEVIEDIKRLIQFNGLYIFIPV